MAGRRARSLVYDDTRDAGQVFPTVDQFTEYTAIAASFAPLASAAVTAPPPPPLPGTPPSISSSAGVDSTGTPEFESIIKSFTDRLLSAITEVLGSRTGASGPESEIGVPDHLRKDERREPRTEPRVEPLAEDRKVETLPDLPADDRDPHERVLDRAAKKRAERRDRLGLPPELPVEDGDGADPLDIIHDRERRKRAERRDRLGLPPELPKEPPREEPAEPVRAPGLDDAIARDAIPATEPSFVIPDREFELPKPAVPEAPVRPEPPSAEVPPLGFGGAAVEDVDSSFQLFVSTVPEPKEPPPSPLPQPEMTAELDTAPASPEFQPPPPKQEPPTEPPQQEPQQEPSFTMDEINDVFVRHGMSPEMPEFVKSQGRPRRSGTSDDPNGYKRYSDEQHDQNLSHMGVLDSMLQAQDDIGRQYNEYNDLMLDYLERIGKDNNNDARRLRALNSKLQRDRTSLTDVNI